ncbi:MAG: hypothetical protein ACT4P1_12650 [Sporichthyaceae bacterium]
MSFHEFTKYDRFRHITRANGEQWTVNIERGNAFQGWRWFNRFEERAAADISGVSLVVAALVDWPFRFAKVISFKVRLRKDWRVTVRPGERSDLGIRHGAVVDERLPSKVEAAKRANGLVREIESGALSDRANSAGPD